MNFLDSLRLRIAALFRRSQLNAEMDEELGAHVQHRADDLERSGLSRADAERRARLEFGGHARFKEECQEAAGGTLIESLFQDVRVGFRMLRKSPGFTAIAIVTLALGIGSNAIVFAVMNALILRPLNLPQEESLYAVQRNGNDEMVRNDPSLSYPDYVDLRERNRTFEDLAAYTIAQAGLDTDGNASRVWLYEVSGNYFDSLGIRPLLGRVFHASDEHGPNSAPFAVMSYRYWHNYFADDPGIVGRTVQLNKHPFTIVGVSPPGFHGTLVLGWPDLFVPMVNQEEIEGTNVLNARENTWVFMSMGHLREGVTPAQAIADLNSVGTYLGKTYPADDTQMTFTLGRPNLYGDYLGRPMRAFLAGLLLLSGLILLAACANLGSLFAARAADRSREIALRLALGSSRLRVLRQLFTEALLLSLMGGAVGLWASDMILSWLSAWKPMPQYPVNVPVNPDAKVYIVALLLSLASGILFGAVPIRQILHTDPYEIVKSGSLGRVGRRITVRDVLLAVQIAICAMLVTSSMVAIRGMIRTLRSNFGFEPRGAILMDTDLHMAGYSGESALAMQKRMLEAVESIPGVTSAGLVDWPPLHESWNDTYVFTDQTSDVRMTNAAAEVVNYKISPNYFRAAGTSILEGRAFTWNDGANSPRVAIVNQEFARRVFGSNANTVGRYFKMQDGTRVLIVGVAQNGKYKNVTEDPQPVMFVPISQSPSSETYMVVRSNAPTQQTVAAIKAAIHGLDSGLPLYVITWDQKLYSAFFASRIATIALGVLGILGAILSVTGIFGLASYSVSKRRRELGIRIALGAQRREVLEAALGRALKLLAFGSSAGLILGILASRVLAHIVFQATPRDPLVLAGVVLAMVLLGLLATWIPAQRALSIDPSMLMREE